jgi:hypothetical protein
MVCKQFLANHYTNHSYIHVFDYDAFNLAKKEPNTMNKTARKRKRLTAYQKLVKSDLVLSEIELKMLKEAMNLERKRNLRSYIT